MPAATLSCAIRNANEMGIWRACVRRWKVLCRHQGWDNLLPQAKGSLVTVPAPSCCSWKSLLASVTVCGDVGARVKACHPRSPHKDTPRAAQAGAMGLCVAISSA